MDTRIKRAHLSKIKRVFQENFLRRLSDEEAEGVLTTMLANTRTDLLPFATEAQFERYAAGVLEIAFSPLTIHAEVARVAGQIGFEALENSVKYKRIGEMLDAASLALALNKVGLGKWMIKSQDAPDILMVRSSDRTVNAKFIDAISLEIMQIPEHEKVRFENEVEADAARFISEKKFRKHYEGVPHLLVHLNFTHRGFNLNRMSAALCKIKGWPFHQIWIRATTNPNFRTIVLSLVYPSYTEVPLNFDTDRHLMY